MKAALFALVMLAAAATAANVEVVPVEFLGTWAVSADECSRGGSRRLTISETAVQTAGNSGFINAVVWGKPRSIEVIFKQPGVRATSRNVYTYMLSPDGTKLFQMRGVEVAVTRIKCKIDPK